MYLRIWHAACACLRDGLPRPAKNRLPENHVLFETSVMFHSELMNSASPSALDNPAASRATPARSGESGDGDFSAILAAARATGEAGPALNRAAGRAAPAQGETQSAEEGASQNADLTIEAGLTSNGAAQSPAPADPRMATPTPGQVAAPLSGAPAPRMADPTPANQTGPITPIPVSDPETGMPGVPRASNPNPGESAAPQPTGQTPVLAGEPSMSGPNPGETAAPQPTGQTPVLAGEPSMSGPNPGETAAPQPTGQTPVLAGEPTMSGPNPGESAAPQPTGQTPVLAGEPAMSGPNPGESVRPQTANPVAATPTPVQVVGGSATTGANPAPNSGGNTAAGTPVAANAAMPAADPLRPMRGEAPAGLTTGIAAKPGANAKPGAAKPGMTAGASAIESGAKASMGGETAAPERPASQPPGPTVGQNSGPNMLPNAASPALAANTPLQPLGDEAGRAALQGEADAVIEMERAARADAARPGAAAPGQQAAHRLPQTTLPHLAAQISKRFSAGPARL